MANSAKEPGTSGTLYVVATPIGNLEDLSPRARQTLAAVDLIASEDTRRTAILLSSIGAKTPQTALHDHNEAAVVPRLIEALCAGRSVALVSDAGTPLVSDPGYRLVQAAHAHAVRVSPVPGPGAVQAALSAAGLPTDRFCFEGFLPPRSEARRRRLEALAAESRTMIFFEAVHRVRDCIDAMRAVFGDGRQAFIGREISKLHEQCVADTLGGLATRLGDGAIREKGEFVLVVGGAIAAASGPDVDALLAELLAVLPGKQAAAITARVTGANRNDVYERMLALRND